MPTQGANFLGAIGAGGVMGAFDGIQRLIDEARAQAEHTEKLKEGEFSRGHRTRQQDEAGRSNLANEGIAGRHASVAEGRLATDRDYFGLANKRDTREESEYQRKLKAIEGLTQRNPGAVGDSILGKSVGINVDSDEFRSPEDIGGRKGKASIAEWLGGLKNVKEGGQQIETDSALKLLSARGDQSMREIAAQGDQTRRSLAAPRYDADQRKPGEQMSALAEQVVDNPDLLDKMTKKDAGAIMREIADAQRAGDSAGIPNRARISADKMRDEALDTLKQIRNHPGFSGAFGAPSLTSPTSLTRLTQLVPGMPAYSLPWGDPADARSLVGQAVSRLTTPRLNYMRGLGALSEREFASLESGATILKNPNISEAAAARELDKLIKDMEDEKAKRGGGSTSGTRGGDGDVMDASAIIKGAAAKRGGGR